MAGLGVHRARGKFVILLEKQGEKIAFGFVHFYHLIDSQYTYVGGIHPVYFNSGLGAYASVAAISFFCDFNERALLKTSIYKHNLRSLRLHLAIGFVITEERKDMYEMLLDKEHFNNNFVLNVKKRVSYQLVQ